MKKLGSTFLLRAAIFLMGILVIILCFFILPEIAKGAGDPYPSWTNLPFLIGLSLSIIPFFLALFQALNLLNLIDKDKAFSESSVRALKIIKYCALVIAVLFATTLPSFFIFADTDDAPGLGLVGLGLTLVPVVIAAFAAVLEKLFRNAIDIKSENDLTV